MANNRLKSRNVHSEIVFSFSPNNNVSLHTNSRTSYNAHSQQIAESFRRFGVTDETSNLLAIKVSTTPEMTAQTVTEHLTKHVEGQKVDFSDAEIAQMRDLPRLRKIYKFDLPKNVPSAASSTDLAQDLGPAISFVLGTMALKGS